MSGDVGRDVRRRGYAGEQGLQGRHQLRLALPLLPDLLLDAPQEAEQRARGLARKKPLHVVDVGVQQPEVDEARGRFGLADVDAARAQGPGVEGGAGRAEGVGVVGGVRGVRVG
ncbi:hypothetical protein SMD44_04613 [Streptomyces alboflavus]|uniref:Uncharacterized protein n=1 Tax=Streptomyces alboflavus TaxID=67267 RepID=A0A1Z1WFD8_9ACTN|nr:hypothetical protein SMD44_04613 [Streptomyces alboflavus]